MKIILSEQQEKIKLCNKWYLVVNEREYKECPESNETDLRKFF
jgi:hypothetical protein